MPETWLERFEGRLDQLERLVSRRDTPVDKLHESAGAALDCLAAISASEIWILQGEHMDCLSRQGQVGQFPESQIRAAADRRGEFVLAADGVEHFLPHHVLADQVCCVFAMSFTELTAPRQSLVEGAQAVVDIVSTQLSHYLLSQYQSQLQQHAGMVELVARLHECATLQEAAGVIVHDGNAMVGTGRLSVVAQGEKNSAVVAMTGVRDPLPEAEAVRAVGDLAASWPPPEHDDADWLDLVDTDDGRQGTAVLKNAGVRAIRCLPLQSAAESSGASRRGATLVAEVFNDDSLPDGRLLQQLAQVSGPVVQSRYEREQSFTDRFLHVPGRRRWAWAAVAIAVLYLVPVQFEVEVPGQLASADRHRIFAPDDGTIDNVLFENEGAIQNDKVIFELSNPELTLSQQRLQGEIGTAATQLASVQALRLSSADPQLSRDERRLTQQIENLKEQLRLVTAQIGELDVKSPCSGTVFRQDARQDLMGQPVQRGQLLAEVVPTDSAWQLNLRIPDRLRSYVVQHRDCAEEPPAVRYLIVSSPQRDWTTSLTSVDNAVQIEDGELVCRATARLTTTPEAKLRPGTSVIARVQCGTASLGFVMFREFVEFWHWIRFAWF